MLSLSFSPFLLPSHSPGKEIQALLKMQSTEEEPELEDSISMEDAPNIKGKNNCHICVLKEFQLTIIT